MPKSQAIPATVSLLGFAVLMAGSLGYMDIYPMGEEVCYALIGIGIGANVIALSVASLSGERGERSNGGNKMGLVEKIKSIFSKKKSDDAGAKAAPKAGKAAGKSRADEFKGEGKVADALRYGAAKIDAKVAAGTLDEKRAAMFMASLKDCEAAAVDDEAKLIQIGQVIGAITFL